MNADVSYINSSPTDILVGKRADGENTFWDLNKRSNFNAIFLGASGSGKTFNMQNRIAPLVTMGVTFHILDVKDDFGYESFAEVGLGNMLSPDHFNDIDLSYVGGEAGINILQFSRVESGGGVYMAIQETLEVMKMFNSSFSQKMGGYMSQLLKDLYTQKGIVHETPETWTQTPPNVGDLLEMIDQITVSRRSGLNRSVLEELEKTRKRAKKAKRNNDKEEYDIQVDAAKDQLGKYANEVCAGGAKYYGDWQSSTLAALREVVVNMVDSQIFTRPSQSVKKGRINRYRIASLSTNHQQLVFRVVLGRVYSMAVMEAMHTGRYNPTFPTHIAVCDEGKHAKQIATSDMSPLNRIATEGRGYGAGLFVGAQSTRHITEDLAGNFASRFITKTDESSFVDCQKYFGITKTQLKKLVPRKNTLFYTTDSKYLHLS